MSITSRGYSALQVNNQDQDSPSQQPQQPPQQPEPQPKPNIQAPQNIYVTDGYILPKRAIGCQAFSIL